jgi:hypothetical protein
LTVSDQTEQRVVDTRNLKIWRAKDTCLLNGDKTTTDQQPQGP